MSLPAPDPPDRALRLRLSRWLIRLAWALVPVARRRELVAQWEAELLHRRGRTERLLVWSLGAFRHAGHQLRTEYTMDLIWQDVRYGFRSLNRSRGLIAIAILSLGVGIGANTSIFSAVDVFMLRPLPYPDSDELYALWTTNADRGWTEVTFSVPDFVDLRKESRAMDVAALRGGIFSLSGDFEAERLAGSYVSPGFFEVLGVEPAVGRAFLPEESVPGNERVALISDGLWKRRFGGDQDLLGSSILLDGEPHTVVGVMPPHFWFGEPDRDVWTPLPVTGEERRDAHMLVVLTRARQGSSRQQVQGDAQRIMEGISREYPGTSAGAGALAMPLHQWVFDEGFKAGTLIATVAVALVLLITCANVANLLLTHAAGRDREVALRAALGAGRVRIVRQFLTEAILVAFVGGVLGVALSAAGIRGLVSLMPPDFPRVHEIGLSPRVLLYTAAVTMLTGVVFGLAPALSASRADRTGRLTEGGRGGTGARGSRLRRGLVVGEVAMALVLLVSSALLVQGFVRIRLADLGFDRADVLVARTLLPESSYADSASMSSFYTRLQARLA
ncbi:MAG TPA: ABC transporter permease, partial [Longimicrobiales bacterium]|nr:ABC transporter permease [Longimicrobiales bacterium]